MPDVLTSERLASSYTRGDISIVIPEQDIPNFEGRPVEGVTTKISGASIEDLDLVVSIDDVVQVLSVFKVTSVHHGIDKDGNLIRQQTLRLQEAAAQPYDPKDPTDDGVIRLLGKPGRNQVAITGAPAAAFSGAATDVADEGEE